MQHMGRLMIICKFGGPIANEKWIIQLQLQKQHPLGNARICLWNGGTGDLMIALIMNLYNILYNILYNSFHSFLYFILNILGEDTDNREEACFFIRWPLLWWMSRIRRTKSGCLLVTFFCTCPGYTQEILLLLLPKSRAINYMSMQWERKEDRF